MSEFFGKEAEKKVYIPPDYDGPSESGEEIDAADVDEGLDEEIDEGAAEAEIEEKENEAQKMITGSTFGTPPQPQTTPWSPPSFGSTPAAPGGPIFGGGNSGGSAWGSGSQRTPWNSGGSIWGGTQKSTEQTQINREKKIIFCDLLDCVVETWDSQGKPGYLPRDIYDLKPRFEVWSKIQAFNPSMVYIMIPINLIPNTNGAQGWIKTLEYFCCGLAAYLRIPDSNCTILAQAAIGQPKEDLIRSILSGPSSIRKTDVIYIGIYSGLAGQSNRDQFAAQVCGIDYVDLGILLNNMY